MHHTTGWQAYIAEHGRNIMGGPPRVYTTIPCRISRRSDWETLQATPKKRPARRELRRRVRCRRMGQTTRSLAPIWANALMNSWTTSRRTSDPDAAENEDTARRVVTIQLSALNMRLKPWATILVSYWHFALPGIMEVCRTCLGTALICVRCATNPRICERRVKFVFFSPSPTNGEGD